MAVRSPTGYANTIAAQAGRINNQTTGFEWVPDCCLQVNALHNLLCAAEMAKKAVVSLAAKPGRLGYFLVETLALVHEHHEAARKHKSLKCVHLRELIIADCVD